MAHANGLAVPVTERGAGDADRSSFYDANTVADGYAYADRLANGHQDANADHHRDTHTDPDTDWHAMAGCHANVLGHSVANAD